MTKNNDIIISERKILTPKYEFNYYNVRNNAWEFLIKNKVTSYPLNLRTIAINNNWHIWSYERYCEKFNISMSELLTKHPKGFSEKYEGLYLICYNNKNPKLVNRFTICHEIGHIVLQHFYKGEQLEKEANMFAARILMPMLLIKELNLITPEKLSIFCQTSIEAASNRLKRYTNDIKNRDKFYTNPREQQLYNQLKSFIEEHKE